MGGENATALGEKTIAILDGMKGTVHGKGAWRVCASHSRDRLTRTVSAFAQPAVTLAPRVSTGGVSRRTVATPRGAIRTSASNTKNPRFALLFDCDGVIVETGASRPRPSP